MSSSVVVSASAEHCRSLLDLLDVVLLSSVLIEAIVFLFNDCFCACFFLLLLSLLMTYPLCC
jgi:hypothetical protein